MIEKHDQRLLDSAINATNMDGQEKKITVTFMVPKATILVILKSYLLVRRYHNHHHQTVLFLD